MKHLAVFALAANCLFAAEFVTGQAARAVIGQLFFTSQDATSSDSVLGGAGGVAYANGMLLVADSNRLAAAPNNNRVLIYRNIAGQLPAPTAEVQRNGLQRCPLCGFKADVVLGQADFTKSDPGLSATGMRVPTSVATDGVRIAVADTDNNRVLIWNSIPAVNGTAPDLVLGQPDFTTSTANSGTGDVRVPSQRSLRGPQGVWISNGMLFVADTQNHRVLIWRTFPTSTFQNADTVVGQKDFTTAFESDLTQTDPLATPAGLLSPVAVTSDGVRLIVTDLGHNRVVIWNTIPTENGAPANLAVGQPDLNSGTANNSYKVVNQGGSATFASVLCESTGTDATTGLPVFPARCARTLNFPRFALSDGTRLFIADGGNDRVLVFNSIPTESGAKADAVLGQVNDTLDQTSDTSANPDSARMSAADAIRTPTSLAWDGSNLYVAEPFSRRVLVFSPGVSTYVTPVRNAASFEVFAVGTVALSGTVTEKDVVTIKINDDKEYSYTALKDDNLGTVANALAAAINAGDSGKGDPWVFAQAIPLLAQIRLTARHGGTIGNNIPVTPTSSNTNLKITAGPLSGGGDAAKLAAGSLITIWGIDFINGDPVSAPAGSKLPTTLGGVEVYVDGIKAPLLYVSRYQINAQLPFEVLDASSCSLYVRMTRPDGAVEVSNAAGIPLIQANPGLFASGGKDPRPAVAVHSSSQATGTVLIDGTAKAGDIVKVKIADAREYSYTVVDGDTLATVRDKLIDLINTDPQVEAFAAGQWTRVRLRARVTGTAGNGIKYTVSEEGGNIIMSATSGALCCASVAGQLVDAAHPAQPGETLTFFATGLGMINDPAKFNVHTGMEYHGPYFNQPDATVSSLAGGKTANVLFAGMAQGGIGIYQIDLELNSDLPTDPATQVTISQNDQTSNIVTFPLVKPASD
ncbi:MAG: hypothetical protein ACM336_14995 [Acidobacteriota bacterium]